MGTSKGVPKDKENELSKTTKQQLFASNRGSVWPLGDFLSLNMSEEQHMGAEPKMETTARIPAEINTKLRALAHDLSNSIETIMQASYLLAQMKLDENAKRWADLIDQAGRDAARINREIRDILRASA